MTKQNFVAAVVLLIAVPLVVIVVQRTVFPVRPLFHNHLTGWGERGPWRYWGAPAPKVALNGHETLLVDTHLNTLVIADHSGTDHDAYALSMTGSNYTPVQAIFQVGDTTYTITADNRNALIVLGPGGNQASARLQDGEAKAMYHYLTVPVPLSFAGALVDRYGQTRPELRGVLQSIRNGEKSID